MRVQDYLRVDGHFTAPEALLDAAAELSAHRRSTWFDYHPTPIEPESGKRARAELVEKVYAIPCDLDWLDESAHSEKDLPTEAELRARLRGFELQPSIVVCSGHGLQPWWLLDAPVDADVGADLISRLHARLEADGMPTDRADLASLLRVPGSLNWKTDTPVEVVVEEADLDRRYGHEYLTHRLGGTTTKRARKGTTGGTDLRGFDHVIARLEADDRDQDAQALKVLRDRYKAHHPYLNTNGELFVTRPDKTAGTSASVGFLAPGVINVFSKGWGAPKLPHGKYRVTDDGTDLEPDTVFDLPTTNGDKPAGATERNDEPVHRRVGVVLAGRGAE